MPKVNIDKELYDQVKKVAVDAGYSSVDEFVCHVLERTISSASGEEDDEDLMKRLQGLGYIS